MKIGYIFTTFPCRSETFAIREIESLKKLGFEIIVFAATGHQIKYEHDSKIKIIYRPPFFSSQAFLSICYLAIKYPLALGKLFCLFLKLIITCPREAALLISNFHTIGFFTKHLDSQAISHIHAYFLNWPAIIGLSISIVTYRSFSISAHARDIFVEHGAIKLKASFARFITTCTQQGSEYLKNRLPKKYHYKLCLNYHGMNISSNYNVSKNYFEKQNNFSIIAVGRFVPKKGFEYLLRAFALVTQNMPYCKLTMVGDGAQHIELERLIKQLNLEDHIELLGWQNADETLLLIRRATLLIAPSLIADDGDRDGIPNVLIEACANGTPIIASNLDSINEIITHHKTGMLVEPKDTEGLASSIMELLTNKSLQKLLSQNAYKMALSRFDSMTNIKQLSKYFMKIS